jgi:hypothetical protein
MDSMLQRVNYLMCESLNTINFLSQDIWRRSDALDFNSGSVRFHFRVITSAILIEVRGFPQYLHTNAGQTPLLWPNSILPDPNRFIRHPTILRYIHTYIVYLAGHSSRAFGDMNSLRSLERWDRGFESHSRHRCLCAFVLRLGSSVCR